MATIQELTPEQQAEWDKWLATRPEVIKQMAAQCPPNKLYRISSGHRVVLYSYCEDRTVTVAVTGKYNLVAFERRVFGIPIDELVECDLPAEDELLGTTMSDEEAEAYIAQAREAYQQNPQVSHDQDPSRADRGA